MKKYPDLTGKAKKAAAWYAVLNKLKDKNFFPCQQDYDPAELIERLKESYKGKLPASDIANAIKEVCEERRKKIGMSYFVTHVLAKLS